MRTITISIGTLTIKVRSERAHEKGPEEKITIQVDWRTLRKLGQAAKIYTVARLRDFLVRFDQYLKDKHTKQMAQWPPHSLFCEKRCCQKSMTSYMRHLKKELVWGADGHLQ